MSERERSGGNPKRPTIGRSISEIKQRIMRKERY